MSKNSYIRILLTFGMSLVIFTVGCVDTSVEPIPSSFNFRSHVSIVNFADGVASADISMATHAGETILFGAVAFGDESSGSFKDVPAGSKTLQFNSESFKFNTEVDKKMRLFVVGTSAEREVVKFTQRYIFQTKDDPTNNSIFRTDTAGIAFANGSTDAIVTKIHAVSADVDTVISFAPSLELGNIASYNYLKAGDYTLSVISNNFAGNADSVITTIQATFVAQQRYTAAVYDRMASLKNKVFIDD